MAQSGFNPGLRLKISGQGRAGTAPEAPPRPDGIEVAMARALGKAAAPFDGLELEPEPDPPQWDIRPPAIVAALPEKALVVMLEAAGEARALCALDPGLVDALIEVQTTGRLDSVQGNPRAPTRIDAALSRDFIGLFLGAFAGELAGGDRVDWPLGLSYGTYLADPGKLDLLLPDRPHHLFSAALALGDGGRTGRILLAVPVTERAEPSQKTDSPDRARWQAAWRVAVMAAPVALEAVLMRRTLPLARIEGLQPGDVLSFDREELAGAEICDVTGRVVFRARLGRAGGWRAVSLTKGGGLPDPPASPPADPLPDPDPPPAPHPPPQSATSADAPDHAETAPQSPA